MSVQTCVTNTTLKRRKCGVWETPLCHVMNPPLRLFSVPLFSSSGTIAETTFFSSCVSAFVANQLATDTHRYVRLCSV